MEEINDNNYYDYIALSASQLKDYAKSPYDFWKHSVFNRDAIYKESKSINLGSLVHCLLLEPEKFFEEYVVNYDNFDMRTKAGKEWKNSQTKTVLSLDDYNHALKMIDCLQKNNFTKALLYEASTEKPFLSDIGDGFFLKGKTDAIKRLSNDDIIIIDYKTTSEDLEKWRKYNTYNFHDIQAAVYQQLCYLRYGKYAKHFYFLVQYTKEDYEDKFNVYEYDQASIDRAIDYVFGKNRNTDFVLEGDEIMTPEGAGLIYKCKRDLFNYFKGRDLEVFQYFKQPVIMDNSSRDYDLYINNFGSEIF